MLHWHSHALQLRETVDDMCWGPLTMAASGKEANKLRFAGCLSAYLRSLLAVLDKSQQLHRTPKYHAVSQSANKSIEALG